MPSGPATRASGRFCRVPGLPVLLLAPGGVDALSKVAAAVEEPDADHRQRLVARLPEEVAGEDAETARVDREGGVDAELGAEERHRPLDPRPRGVWAGEIGVHLRSQRLDPLQEHGVTLHRLLRGRPEVAEKANRIRAGQCPAVGVDVAEDRRPVAQPAPHVVVGDRRERLEAVRELVGEMRRAGLEVGRAGREDGRGGHLSVASRRAAHSIHWALPAPADARLDQGVTSCSRR